MKKKLITIMLCLLLTITSFSIAYATPPSNPHIESGSADDGGNFFEYKSDNGSWYDLKTPPHWVVETGEVAYCLEHLNDSAQGELYYTFDPQSVYSERTYNGLRAILMHSYPYRTAGLTDQEIRYATANAIRSWLRESEGVGYDFMLQSANRIRPKSTGQGPYNFYMQLMDKARAGASVFIQYGVIISPETVTLTEQNGFLKGLVTVTLQNLRGGYSIDYSKLPSGVTISGCTGNNGNILEIKAPLSMQGQDITISNVFIGKDDRGSANFYWLDTSSGKQAVVVPVVNDFKPVVYNNLSFTSEPPPYGYIEIYLKDSESGTRLQGAVYKILDEDGNKVDELTTNSDGYVKSSLLHTGGYSLIEVTTPSGYCIDSTAHSATVSAQSTTTLNLTNEQPKGVIRINITNIRTDWGDYSLEGAKLSISDASGTVIEAVTTDSQGYANSSELPLGTYKVKEISAPYGFVLNRATYTANLTYENSTTAIVYDDINVPQQPQIGKIKITLTNANPAAGDYSLEGAVFEVRDIGGNLVTTVTTNSGGYVDTNELLLGKYTVKEITAPYGYILNETEYTANLSYIGQEVGLTYKILKVPMSPQTGTITIIKRDFETGDIPQGNSTLNGAIFEVCDSDGTFIERLECGESDHATGSQLPLGTYTIKEVHAPVGYLLNETNYTVELSYSDQTVEVSNQSFAYPNSIMKGRIAITKFADVALAEWNTDNLNPPLQGVEFEIRLKSTSELVDTLVTDAEGKAQSKELPYGTYVVSETKTTQGYIACDPFEVGINENGKVYSYNIENKVIRSQVKIVKVDSETGDIIPIAGTEFQIRDANSNLIVQTDPQDREIDTFVTDETGTITLPEPLIYGDYTLHEVNAPYGYWLAETPLAFSIDNSGADIVTVDFSDVLIEKRINIVKTDARDNERKLAGAVFEVYKDSDLVDTITAEDNGTAETKLLTVGEYRVVEVKAPIGFILDDLAFQQVISDDETMIYTIQAENRPTEVIITVIDILDNAPLPNAHIEVYSIENELMDEGSTDDKGELIIQELPIGEYTLKEIAVPDGYILSNETLAFGIDESGVVTGNTEIFNSPTALRISKVKYEDNTPLYGAGFLIKKHDNLEVMKFSVRKDGTFKYDVNGKVAEVLVDKNGQAVIYGLPFGSYWLEESTVPKGYYPTAPVKVTIDETNNIQKPAGSVIPNSVFVKLGLDRERYIIPIAIGGVLLTTIGLFFAIRKKRK